ncbi:odorant receptor 131-2-like [Erpetoichthys calabaricus]|uniref:odorant receptor 131-2-like n=1 Tax=Erpetoichthys calabaricus TaxID=27687 RepID=UPI0022340AD4|nr:odorant receptor 131-2-like [Erpetoichthys calabaricus]
MNSTGYSLEPTNFTDEGSVPGFNKQTKSVLKMSLVVLLYIVNNYINGMLITAFFKHHVFHGNSRYVLFIHLVFNDVLDISVLLILHIWVETLHIMPVSLCYLFLIIAVTTTYNTPLNLALMALERYIAICKPLHHPKICTLRRTYIILGIMWLISFISPASDIIIVFNIEPLSFFSTEIICETNSFIRVEAQELKRDFLIISYFALAWLTMAYTYIHIAIAARSASRSEKSSARKAYNTVLLHAIQLTLSTIMFLVPLVDSLWLYYHKQDPRDVQYYTHILIILFPRLLSPLIYGIREENFRKYLKGYVKCCTLGRKESPNQTIKQINGSED